MQNSKHLGGEVEDPTYPRFVIVVTQFEEKLNAQRVLAYMKTWQNQNTQHAKIATKGFHFRLAGEPIAL